LFIGQNVTTIVSKTFTSVELTRPLARCFSSPLTPHLRAARKGDPRPTWIVFPLLCKGLARASGLARRTEIKARRLIDGASFGPETLKAVGEAFDKAWEQIAGNFSGDAQSIEAARLKLAQAILSIADDSSRDVETLKNGGLQAMAQDYRTPQVKPASPPDGTAPHDDVVSLREPRATIPRAKQALATKATARAAPVIAASSIAVRDLPD
jgi:hypothetical protein